MLWPLEKWPVANFVAMDVDAVLKQSQFADAMPSQDEYERLRYALDGQLNAVRLVLQKEKTTETIFKLVLPNQKFTKWK